MNLKLKIYNTYHSLLKFILINNLYKIMAYGFRVYAVGKKRV